MDNGRQFRILLVDDHRHARQGMREIVAEDGGFIVVGEAASGEEALAMMERTAPELVLMDINMPGMGGLEAAKAIKAGFPETKIVIVTVSDDPSHLFEALKKGAQGYLLKNLNPSAWREYLRAIASDEAPLNPDLALAILREFAAKARPDAAEAGAAPDRAGEGGAGVGRFRPGTGEGAGAGGRAAAGAGAAAGYGSAAGGAPRAEAAAYREDLTPRERDILQEVALGRTNRDIAARLGLSENTVKNHLKNILQKLHLGNRVQLTRYAYERGLVEP